MSDAAIDVILGIPIDYNPANKSDKANKGVGENEEECYASLALLIAKLERGRALWKKKYPSGSHFWIARKGHGNSYVCARKSERAPSPFSS